MKRIINFVVLAAAATLTLMLIYMFTALFALAIAFGIVSFSF